MKPEEAERLAFEAARCYREPDFSAEHAERITAALIKHATDDLPDGLVAAVVKLADGPAILAAGNERAFLLQLAAGVVEENRSPTTSIKLLRLDPQRCRLELQTRYHRPTRDPESWIPDSEWLFSIDGEQMQFSTRADYETDQLKLAHHLAKLLGWSFEEPTVLIKAA